MFDPQGTPRVFGLPPGVDFPAALVDRLTRDFQGKPPEALARVRLIVNTRRMARRIRDLFDAGPALLLPRVQLVTDLGAEALAADVPPAVSPLRRRLEISQLVSGLLDRQPDLAPRASLFDLSDSLAALLDEMHGEGVPPEALAGLDVSNHSDHWARALEFLKIVQHFFDQTGEAPDAETRQRLMVQALSAAWAAAPPADPVILAGSTGSRGTTMLLMQAVAALPQGAIVLPGYDFGMTAQSWADLDDPLTGEDHPQFRFRVLMHRLGIGQQDIRRWSDAAPHSPARGALVSLALRPAPVTDAWLAEGPDLGPLGPAMEAVTLVEAPSQRDEALAIAMRLRTAVEEGKTAALITPDRMLTRQVTAALDRWDILPDDSAGTPLQLTPPGRFLRHVAALFHRKSDAEALITVLNHPLTHSGGERGPHLIHSREFELYVRRKGLPFPGAEDLRNWAAGIKDDSAAPWAEWVIANLLGQQDSAARGLPDHVARHLALAETLAQGPHGVGSGGLWEESAGRAAKEAVEELIREAGHGGAMSASDYADMFGAILSRGEVRDRDAPHPDILIWGTLEARVQGADLLILGGLNEGSWPEMPAPDPWLNRKMRHDAGLLLPERRIGLSAHDFQQAIAAPEVWLTRAIRSDDAETVASRWVNRLMNLLNGLPAQGGREALAQAKARGAHWLGLVRALEAPGVAPAAPRPSPCPPAEARPRQLSVTAIKRLIRDPYAIYAEQVLRLRPLDPLMRAPDALLRGIVTHDVLETFLKTIMESPEALRPEVLIQTGDATFDAKVPWAEIRALWQARLARVAAWFVETEQQRLELARPVGFEIKGKAMLPDLGFALTAKADRIDRGADGRVHIYDYKTGQAPNEKQQLKFDKQLLLEAAMVSEGAFEGLDPSEVARAVFISLATNPKEEPAPIDAAPIAQVWAEFRELITAYLDPKQGFTARRAMFKDEDTSTYDQLARFGEWDTTAQPIREVLT